MAQYFFHLRDGADTLLDDEGCELADIAAVARQALREARSLISQEALAGAINLAQRLEVEDGLGVMVYRLDFEDAIAVRHPA
jgi:hypothetical protein